MTGTNLYVNKCKQSRSYLNHLVLRCTVLQTSNSPLSSANLRHVQGTATVPTIMRR